MLQRGGAAEYHEAQLAIFEAGVKVDQKYMALGFEEPFHGEAYLDSPSIRGFYHGEWTRRHILGFCLHSQQRWTSCLTL
jgi:hypothetical protein